MKGMVSVSVVGSASLIPGGYGLFQNKTGIEQPVNTYEPNAFLTNYDFLSGSAMGMAATSFIQNNMDNLYTIMLTLIALTIFFMFGVPSTEYFIYPAAEQIAIN